MHAVTTGAILLAFVPSVSEAFTGLSTCGRIAARGQADSCKSAVSLRAQEPRSTDTPTDDPTFRETSSYYNEAESFATPFAIRERARDEAMMREIKADPNLAALFADHRVKGAMILLRNVPAHQQRQVFEEDYGSDPFMLGARDVIFKLFDKYR